MRLTTKGRFAVTAMLDLALNEAKDSENSRPVTLAGISERQAISLSYLEQLFSRLRRQGLVTSVRGPGGGYRGLGNIGQRHGLNDLCADNAIGRIRQCDHGQNRDDREHDQHFDQRKSTLLRQHHGQVHLLFGFMPLDTLQRALHFIP